MTSLSKHFMATDVSATGGYGGLLETCWYYRFGQGQVENVSEHLPVGQTLASWSARARSTRPGNPPGPATCLKVLLTLAMES